MAWRFLDLPLAECIGRIGVALQPLAERFSDLLRQRQVLHADEAPVPQLDPGKGKTKRAYLWAYRSNSLEPGAPIVLFEFQPGRSCSNAQGLLANWPEHLMVDNYAGYKHLINKASPNWLFWHMHAENSLICTLPVNIR